MLTLQVKCVSKVSSRERLWNRSNSDANIYGRVWPTWGVTSQPATADLRSKGQSVQNCLHTWRTFQITKYEREPTWKNSQTKISLKGIPPWFLNRYASHLTPTIHDIFQSSVDSRQIPKAWMERNKHNSNFFRKETGQNIQLQTNILKCYMSVDEPVCDCVHLSAQDSAL